MGLSKFDSPIHHKTDKADEMISPALIIVSLQISQPFLARLSESPSEETSYYYTSYHIGQC